MAENVRFYYMHRDFGNYKEHGQKDFSNPNNHDVVAITRMIRKCLIDQEFFYPESFGISKFEFHRGIDDGSWYEFTGVALVQGDVMNESIDDFLQNRESVISQ